MVESYRYDLYSRCKSVLLVKKYSCTQCLISCSAIATIFFCVCLDGDNAMLALFQCFYFSTAFYFFILRALLFFCYMHYVLH